MTRLISIVVLLALSGLAALAGAPTAQIRVTTDKLLSVLKDEALAKEEKLEVKRDKMTEIISDHFDWKLISRGCLGRHWRKLSEKERQSFETKFKGLLQRTYLTQLETYFTDLESINYRSERIQGNYASVKTVFSTKKNTKHPVEYRLKLAAGNRWRIYDGLIEGISMVKNYRVQFDEILARNSFVYLLEQLEKKNIEFNP